MVAVKEPCPEVYFPSEAPARAVVAPALESSAAGGRKLTEYSLDGKGDFTVIANGKETPVKLGGERITVRL